MTKPKLDRSEKEFLEAFESGDLKSTLTTKRRGQLKSAAENTLKKDKRINIRISSRDLEAIQRRALEQGIPCQTPVSSVLHKYISGSLHDVTTDRQSKRTE